MELVNHLFFSGFSWERHMNHGNHHDFSVILMIFLWDFLDDQVDLFRVLALRQWPPHHVGQPHDVCWKSKRTEFGHCRELDCWVEYMD